MSKASEKQMDTLHGALAKTLTRMVEVRTIHKVTSDGDPVEEEVEPSPAALAVAAKFLKDNSIFSTPEQNNALAELGDKLRKRRPSAQDLKDAMKSIGNDLLQ